MSIRKMLWSLLAGVSISLAGGCDEDTPPRQDVSEDELMIAYGVPDMVEDPVGDMVDIQDMAAEDVEPDGELPQTDYGPPTP